MINLNFTIFGNFNITINKNKIFFNNLKNCLGVEMLEIFQNSLSYVSRDRLRGNEYRKLISQIDPIPKYFEDHGALLSDLSFSISPSSSSCSMQEKSRKKWTNVTKQLALFTTTRAQPSSSPDELYTSSDAETYPDYEHEFATKKKRLKVKKLIKSNQLKSVKYSSVLLNSNLDKKKNCKYLFLKYNLYKKEFVDYYYNFYVRKIQRARHLYAKNKSNNLDEEFLVENKKIFKNLKLADKIIENSKSKSKHKLDDFVVDYGQVDQDLEQNVDDMYLNFLIQLQHREITPEDYEHLARLDEFVKKKSLSKQILKKLKTEPVNEWIRGEKCGICYEDYEYGQLCKYLPCGHIFHSDCVENWLAQSTNCPLDNLSVEETWHQMVEIEKSVKNVINDLVKEIEQQIS